MKAYTDYPFTQLGDTAGQEAPIREIEVLYYDGDKRCSVSIIRNGIMYTFQVKAGYIYQKPGRYGEVEPLTNKQLESLNFNGEL